MPKLAQVTVIPPAKTDTVSVLPHLAVSALTALTPERIAADLIADHEAFERTSKQAAFIALRIGIRLIWLRDNSAHGSLAPFMAAHLPTLSERTLYRYIKIADDFLTTAGLRDKKTHLLTGKALEQAAPILTEQLELFTDPKARLEGALKKLVKFVGDRGLADLYRSLEAKTGAPSPPPGGGKKGRLADTPQNAGLKLEQIIEHAREELQTLRSIHEADAWRRLPGDELAPLETLLETWLADVRAALKPAAKKSRS